MICPDCNGRGNLGKARKKVCFALCMRCDGSGELCGVCGEAADEPGQNICPRCEREREQDQETKS